MGRSLWEGHYRKHYWIVRRKLDRAVCLRKIKVRSNIKPKMSNMLFNLKNPAWNQRGEPSISKEGHIRRIHLTNVY